MGGGIYSITLVRTSVRTYEYICTSVRTKNGFRGGAISFETIGVLDYYFMHRYMIMKYWSGSIRIQSIDYYQSYCP